eukprot:1097681_1
MDQQITSYTSQSWTIQITIMYNGHSLEKSFVIITEQLHAQKEIFFLNGQLKKYKYQHYDITSNNNQSQCHSKSCCTNKSHSPESWTNKSHHTHHNHGPYKSQSWTQILTQQYIQQQQIIHQIYFLIYHQMM